MERINKIIGEKVSLSLVEMPDISKIVELCNDFLVSDGIGYSDFVATIPSMQGNIEEDLRKERPTFSIIDNKSKEMIGFCRLHNTEYLHRTASLMIAIDRQHQDKGYGEESINLLLDYAFNYLDFYNIMLVVYEFNKKAIKCYEKVGFKKFGTRTKARYHNGKRYDVVYMECLKDEFKGDYIKNKIRY